MPAGSRTNSAGSSGDSCAAISSCCSVDSSDAASMPALGSNRDLSRVSSGFSGGSKGFQKGSKRVFATAARRAHGVGGVGVVGLQQSNCLLPPQLAHPPPVSHTPTPSPVSDREMALEPRGQIPTVRGVRVGTRAPILAREIGRVRALSPPRGAEPPLRRYTNRGSHTAMKKLRIARLGIS
jgi:hypothetical protein